MRGEEKTATGELRGATSEGKPARGKLRGATCEGDKRTARATSEQRGRQANNGGEKLGACRHAARCTHGCFPTATHAFWRVIMYVWRVFTICQRAAVSWSYKRSENTG